MMEHFEKCPSYHLNILYRLLLIFQTADVYFRSNVYLDSLKHSISKMFSWADQMLLIQANFPCSMILYMDESGLSCQLGNPLANYFLFLSMKSHWDKRLQKIASRRFLLDS